MSKVKKCNRTLSSSIGALLAVAIVFTSVPCAAKVIPKGRVVIVDRGNFAMTGGDCHTSRSSHSTVIKTIIHEGLVCKRDDGRIHPALAKSWEIASDGLTMKFTLDERAKFHNGEPVTSEDVKFSFERIMRPELKFIFGREMRGLIDRIELENERNVVIHLKGNYPAFLDRCAEYIGIIPKRYTEKVGDAEFARHPVGAGPFRWVEGKQDIFFKAEAVENHYRKVPYVKELVYRLVGEASTRLAMLKTGEADIAHLEPEHISVVKRTSDLNVIWSKYNYLRAIVFYDLAFPDESSPFHDKRVRKAVSYAINREKICEKVLHGSFEPWGEIYAPYILGFDPAIKPDPYDPAKAKDLLAKAGYPNGFDTVIHCFPDAKLGTEAIAADLREVGIRAKLDVLEHGIWRSMLFGKKFRGIGNQPGPFWMGRSNPATALQVCLQANNPFTYVTTPELNSALEKLNGLIGEKDIEAEAKKVSKMYLEQLLRVNLWALHEAYGVGPRVEYYKITPGWHANCFEYLKLKNE